MGDSEGEELPILNPLERGSSLPFVATVDLEITIFREMPQDLESEGIEKQILTTHEKRSQLLRTLTPIPRSIHRPIWIHSGSFL